MGRWRRRWEDQGVRGQPLQGLLLGGRKARRQPADRLSHAVPVEQRRVGWQHPLHGGNRPRVLQMGVLVQLSFLVRGVSRFRGEPVQGVRERGQGPRRLGYQVDRVEEILHGAAPKRCPVLRIGAGARCRGTTPVAGGVAVPGSASEQVEVARGTRLRFSASC